MFNSLLFINVKTKNTKLYSKLFELFDSIAKMLGGFFMSINIENMEKPKCAKIFWQMQKQFRLTTMILSGHNYM